MKFLCSNCGSKYQIADEKVNGRVLRMKCRKCAYDIVIDGQNPAGPSVRPPAAEPAPSPARNTGSQRLPESPGMRMPQRPVSGEPASRRVGAPSSPGSVQQPARGAATGSSSALGAGFRRQISTRPGAPSPAQPSRNEAIDQWHVAVNDVPVGPIGRQEILRKIGAGAVTETSLVWREGFDDWRPLREVPDLAALLRQAQPSRPAPPPIAKSPPTGPARAQGPARQIGSRPTPHPHRAGDALRATASRSNVVPMPIGGRLGGAAAPAFEPSAETAPETSLPYAADMGVGGSAETALVQDPGPAPAAHASVPPAGVFDAPGPQPPQQVIVRQGLPVAAWMGIAMAGGAGVVLAFILGTKFLAPVAQPVPEATKEEGVPAKAEDVVPQKEGAVVLPEDVVVENTEPVVEEETDSKGASSSTRKSTKTTTAATKQPELSEEDRKRLAAMSGGTGGSFSNIGTKDTSDRATKQSSPLTAEQISSVVTKNKAQLQQCYSRSLRGVAATSAIRVNVTLRIGGSGRVTSVTIAGADLPGLSTCMQSAVKKWVFPASGQESATAFPIVFSPGG